MAKVVLYTTDWCPYCRSAKRLLDGKGVSYEEIDLTDDDEGRTALTQRTGRSTVPQIFVGDVHVGGFDDLRLLDRSGGLDPLLRE